MHTQMLARAKRRLGELIIGIAAGGGSTGAGRHGALDGMQSAARCNIVRHRGGMRAQCT